MSVNQSTAGLISLEPWDGVWRRNQHLAAQLVRQGHLSRLVFVNPPVLGRHVPAWSPEPGIRVVTPHVLVPRRFGGLRGTAAELRVGALRTIDVLWVNAPRLGALCLRRDVPAVYDVTDDWRAAAQPPRMRRPLVSAESRLARRAATVVCSDVLHERWKERYGVDADVIHNGLDLCAWRTATARELSPMAPHVGYVGTLHDMRLDLDLVVDLAAHPDVGTVHLVGPDCLEQTQRERLRSAGVLLHGAVPAHEVPSWMLAMDLLISPHLVNDFTLSLDAIKGREYAASGRPVVATPTSGFPALAHTGVVLADREDFVVRAVGLLLHGRPEQVRTLPEDDSWEQRARIFAAVLGRAVGQGS